MLHAKANVPTGNSAGHRAAAFVDSLKKKVFYRKCWLVGIPFHEYRAWKRGAFPCSRSLKKLADHGADVSYILTGKRITD